MPYTQRQRIQVNEKNGVTSITTRIEIFATPVYGFCDRKTLTDSRLSSQSQAGADRVLEDIRIASSSLGS